MLDLVTARAEVELGRQMRTYGVAEGGAGDVIWVLVLVRSVLVRIEALHVLTGSLLYPSEFLLQRSG